MEVNISVVFDQDPSPGYYSMIMGGIQVKVDETILTQFVDQDKVKWASEWQPEYTGEYIHQILVDLLEALQRLKRGEVQQYEKTTAHISPVGAELVFEPVSEREVRLAFQATGGPVEPELGFPPAESALGYLVNIDSLCREGIICGNEFIEYADGRENVRDGVLDGFMKLVEDLDSLCEEYEGIPKSPMKGN